MKNLKKVIPLKNSNRFLLIFLDLAGRNLTDEDVKFLTAVEESKLQRERSIKEENEAALHEFRIRHELLARESHLKEFSGMTEPNKSTLAKVTDKLKVSEKKTLPSDSTIKSKRNLLGIAPKSNK